MVPGHGTSSAARDRNPDRGLTGGVGTGAWCLALTGPISAMSLLGNPNGHLTNLSTASMR